MLLFAVAKDNHANIGSAIRLCFVPLTSPPDFHQAVKYSEQSDT
jgi:hypothetical protein